MPRPVTAADVRQELSSWMRSGARDAHEWIADGAWMLRSWFRPRPTEQEAAAALRAHIQQHMDAISGVSPVARGTPE